LTTDDPGLAADRTTLAWRRSGISVIAVGVAVARGIPTVDAVPSRPVAGLVIVALGALAFGVSSRQAARRGAHPGTARPTAGLADLWPVTAATVLAALGAIAVVLLV
jgi:putative membrane protein